MTSVLRAGLVAAVALALAGCGGATNAQPSAAGTSTVTTASTAASGSAAALAKEDPHAILKRAAAALRSVRSYHIDGTETDKDGTSRLSGDVIAPGRVRLALTLNGQTVRIIVIGAETYLRASRSFWVTEGGVRSSGSVADLLADRWVKAPDSSTKDLTDIAQRLTPEHLAACVAVHIGTLTNRGADTVDGEPVVVINDKGNVPRGAPGDLYLAASGPLVPLRLVQTGPDRLDGPRNVRCEGPATKDETPTLRSETRMSAFNKAIRIDTPAGVLDLNQDGTTLGGQA